MEIGGDGKIAALNISPSGLERIAEKLSKLQQKEGKGTPPPTHIATEGVPSERIPAINHILPKLLKILAEMKGELGKATLDSVASSRLAKDPKDISPFSFLSAEERDTLQNLFRGLLQKDWDSEHSPTVAQAVAQAVAQVTQNPKTPGSHDQWALLGTFRRVAEILSLGEDRLHESVNRQLSPEQKVFGNFLKEKEQNEVIGLLAQRALLQEKAQQNPLNKQEKALLEQIDSQVIIIFANVEKRLQKEAGINIKAIKFLLEKYFVTGIPSQEEFAKVFDVAKTEKAKHIQNDVREILLETLPNLQNNRSKGSVEQTKGLEAALNFIENNLSNPQQFVLALMPEQEQKKALELYAKAGELTSKGMLSPNQANELAKLTNQGSLLLQNVEKKLTARGIDVEKLAQLFSNDSAPSLKEIEHALSLESGHANQQATIGLIADVFLEGHGKDRMTLAKSATASEGSVVASTLVKNTQGTEYPAPLTPLQALQKRIEEARQLVVRKAQQAQQKNEIAHAADASKQVVAAQPVQAPAESAEIVNQFSIAGLSSTSHQRSVV